MSLSPGLFRPISLHAFSSASTQRLVCSGVQRSTLKTFHRQAVSHFTSESPSRSWSNRANFFTAALIRNAHTVLPPRPTPSFLELLRNIVLQATHRTSRIFKSPSGPPRPQGRAPVTPVPPPSPSSNGGWRKTLNSLPSDVIFWGILVVNGVVFLMWQYAVARYQASGDARWYIWMNQNFPVSMTNVSAGRIWTILTSCFSHESTSHLLFNALTYYWMAPAVLQLLGNTSFLALYLGGGVIASCASLWWNNSVKKNRKDYASHGASGAIYSIVSFFACLDPTTKFYLFAVIPIPAWAFVTGILAWDGYTAVYERQTGTDAAGHVGGIFAGIAYFIRLRYRVL